MATEAGAITSVRTPCTPASGARPCTIAFTAPLVALRAACPPSPRMPETEEIATGPPRDRFGHGMIARAVQSSASGSVLRIRSHAAPGA
ncbi:hypothetical protein GCM10009767_20300 [Kocuria aegyptia]|uniref:ATP-binding protein n=1 Tax=Kocuria aegyptia TaxID=330943 RepID=A0ABP4WRS2_9MICC